MPEIRKIKRKDLDLEKYSRALAKALNYRIYAEYWYLDNLLQNNWECLVYGDYEVIMPIPIQKKFGFKFVTQPIFCQQLGVFYSEKIPVELFRSFEKKLKKYRVRGYHYNENNTEDFQPEGSLKINQILDLSLPYEEIRKKYNRNRRRKLIDLPEGYELKLGERTNDFIELFEGNYGFLIKGDRSNQVKNFMETAFAKKQGYQYRIENNGKLVASLFYIKTPNRLFQLGAARDKSITDIGFFTMIIDRAIQDFAHQPGFEFDFEGSSIPGVHEFNRSFGAVQKNFTIYKNFR